MRSFPETDIDPVHLCQCNLHKNRQVNRQNFAKIAIFATACISGRKWGKTGGPGQKPLGSRKRTSNKLNPHMAPGPGIQHVRHWWKASAVIAASSLLPRYVTGGHGTYVQKCRLMGLNTLHE